MNITVDTYCGGMFQTNGYLLTMGEGDDVARLLIDAPEGVADWLKSMAIDKLDAVLLTHQHHDHIIGLAKLQGEFETETLAFSKFDRELTLVDSLVERMGIALPLDEYAVNQTLTDGSKRSFAGEELTCFHTPGHSPDSLSFYWEAAGICFGGDVLFHRSVGRSDFPHSDPQSLINSIQQKLFPLPEKTVIYPGHGPETTIGEEKRENPFVRAAS